MNLNHKIWFHSHPNKSQLKNHSLNHSKRKTFNQNWVEADTSKRNHLARTSEWPRAYPLDANIVDFQTNIPEDEEDWEAELPPDFALIGALGTELKSLDDALSGPHAKEWQTTLDYKIGQLEKLGTWVIEDLPKGHNTILCNAMLKEKCGLDDKFTSY